MGADCSNCKCANQDDEKILMIENVDKINTKPDTRKDKLEMLEKSKGTRRANINNFNIDELLEKNEGLLGKIVKLQSMIRRYRDRKTYKAILKKFRVINLILNRCYLNII